VALFRFMLPEADITVAGGREKILGDYLSWLPLAGANGVMIGNYLTTRGRDLQQDQRMLEQGRWI
jgi:biotin synthase